MSDGLTGPGEACSLPPGGQEENDNGLSMFGIVITAQMRHADLWEAREKLGTNHALAQTLGVTDSTVGCWINLKQFPNFRFNDKRRQELADRLLVLTGKSMEELWPHEVQMAIKSGVLSRKLMLRRDVALAQLANRMVERSLLPSPEMIVRKHELKANLEAALDRLRPRYRDVLRLHFGFEGSGHYTLEELGRIMKVSKERVRQILTKALERLNHDKRFRQQFQMESEDWAALGIVEDEGSREDACSTPPPSSSNAATL